ncbi:hypothetical protein AGOR_G00213570 [Albula goreensis]|uniref:Clathrin heavy chain linker domain-containing protein 1 n=1 Tax=Albula goreensis TaxID=1534307 RepID=A0A8T3CUV7_9TELE|nr:hypothetical protein AGOR_G00213570 [Albula goreensis]
MADAVTRKSVSSESSFTGAEALPPIASAADRKFFESLQKYIQDEKKRLTPSGGPNEQRYNIYRCAFDKVIEGTSAYRMVLSAIKREYDEFIGAVRRSQRSARLSEGKQRASAARPTAVLYYRRSAAQLQHRTEIIHKSTTEFHAELRELQRSREERVRPLLEPEEPAPTGPIPGLTLDQSTDLTALEVYLEHLQQRRAELQRKIQNQYESRQVKAHLDSKVKRALNHRDKLSTKNQRLELRYKQMALVHEGLSSWEKSEKTVPLAQLLPSVLHQVSHLRVSDSHWHGAGMEDSEDDDPAKVKASKLVTQYVQRFTELFEGGAYEAAALHAARSPGGILWNLETFGAIQRHVPALVMAVPAGKQLPGRALAVEGVRAALECACIELVTHWVSQHRLTFSEELGDVISAHAHREEGVADTCLALAQVVYSTCGLHSKTALSMCRRGFISAAVEFIYSNKDFTPDDCVSVLQGCPSVALLQALTQGQARPAALSVGLAALCLLGTNSRELAFQLLQRLQQSGTLQRAVLGDSCCSVQEWREVAVLCRAGNRPHLAHAINCALTCLQGQRRSHPVSRSPSQWRTPYSTI